MSAAETGATTPTLAHVSGVDVNLLRALLGNVADAIDKVLTPELSGSARSRAGECVGILTRAALSLEAAGDTLAGPLAQLAAQTKPVAAAAWNTVAAIEGDVLDQLESRAASSQPSATAGSSSRTFDRERLERYLQRHALGGAAVAVSDCRLLAGGRSKQTVLVSLKNAAKLPEQIVVRQDWSSAVTGTSVVTEFDLLKRIFDAGLRVPQPLLLERSSEPLGSPFIVVTRMPGGPQGDLFNPPKSEQVALELAAQLARLHQLPQQDFIGFGVPTEASSAEQLRAGLAGFRAMNEKLGPPSHTIGIALDWLAANIDKVQVRTAVVHNDLGCHNFLIEGQTLTAILDWELANIGHPAADLGYIRDWIGKMTPWPNFMQAYHAAGGPAIDEATLDFYTLWTGVRLYCLLLQARAGVAMGMVKDTEITFAVAHFHPVLLQRISRELRAILEPAKTS